MTELRKMGKAQSRRRSTNAGVKLTTFIPMRIVRHRANWVIVRPGADGHLATSGEPDANLLNALARAFYWQQLLDSGRVANIGELATQEGVDRVRVQKTLKLARLAPELAEDIAAGRIPVGLSFDFFIRRELPDEWLTQRQVIAALSK